jgi:hypothetical protein
MNRFNITENACHHTTVFGSYVKQHCGHYKNRDH